MYNLFRRRQEPDIVCAVPEARPVPSFLIDEGWTFQGKISGDAFTDLGTSERLARHSVEVNGFYVLHQRGGTPG
jgi:hypothetical protein